MVKSDAEVRAFEPAKKNLLLKLLIHHKTTIGRRTKYSLTKGSILQDQRDDDLHSMPSQVLKIRVVTLVKLFI